MGAEIHGGWVMENCKKGLNEYCQKHKVPTPVYVIKQISSTGSNSNFVATYSLYVSAISKS